MPYFEICDLSKHYPPQIACSELTFDIERGESVGIVGESGCGKSTLAKLLAGLIPRTKGSIHIDSKSIDSYSPIQLARAVQLIFQHSSLALNPKLTIRQILEEPLRIHQLPTKNRAEEALSLAQLPIEVLDRYPHQLSGGQRQRVNVMRALMLEPKLLILDESLASQDDETKEYLIRFLKKLRWEKRVSYLIISHDLPLIETLTDRLFVMYAGRFVEWGATKRPPRHPYTKALFAAEASRLPLLKGDYELPDTRGCPLNRRCPVATAECHSRQPPKEHVDGRTFFCHSK